MSEAEINTICINADYYIKLVEDANRYRRLVKMIKALDPALSEGKLIMDIAYLKTIVWDAPE